MISLSLSGVAVDQLAATAGSNGADIGRADVPSMAAAYVRPIATQMALRVFAGTTIEDVRRCALEQAQQHLARLPGKGIKVTLQLPAGALQTSDRHQLLRMTGVRDGSTIKATMEPYDDSAAINITVQRLTGKLIPISIKRSQTVLTLKQKIQVKEGIRPDQQSLVFAGTQLENDLTLADYGVQGGSTVHFITLMRGD